MSHSLEARSLTPRCWRGHVRLKLQGRPSCLFQLLGAQAFPGLWLSCPSLCPGVTWLPRIFHDCLQKFPSSSKAMNQWIEGP